MMMKIIKNGLTLSLRHVVTGAVWFMQTYQFTHNPIQSTTLYASSILGLAANLCAKPVAATGSVRQIFRNSRSHGSSDKRG